MLVCHGLSSAAAAAAGDAGDAAAPTADAAGEDDDLLTLRLEKKGLRSESDDEVERRGEPRLLKADDDEEDEVADSSKSGGGMTRSGIGGRHAMAGGRCRFYRVSDAIATTRTTIRLYGRERERERLRGDRIHRGRAEASEQRKHCCGAIDTRQCIIDLGGNVVVPWGCCSRQGSREHRGTLVGVEAAS